MLDRDARSANLVDGADRWAVLPGDRSAGPAEKDVGKGVALPFIAALVDVQHDIPWGAWLHAVEVTQRQNDPQPGEVDTVRITLLDVPRQGTETLSVRRWAARRSADAADGQVAS